MKQLRRGKLPFGNTVKRGVLVNGVPTRNQPAKYDYLAIKEGPLKQRILERNTNVKRLFEEKNQTNSKKKINAVRSFIGEEEVKEMIMFSSEEEVQILLKEIGKDKFRELMVKIDSGKEVGSLITYVGSAQNLAQLISHSSVDIVCELRNYISSKSMGNLVRIAGPEAIGKLASSTNPHYLNMVIKSAGSSSAVGQLVNSAGFREVGIMINGVGPDAIGKLINIAGPYFTGRLTNYIGPGGVNTLIRSSGSISTVGEILKQNEGTSYFHNNFGIVINHAGAKKVGELIKVANKRDMISIINTTKPLDFAEIIKSADANSINAFIKSEGSRIDIPKAIEKYGIKNIVFVLQKEKDPRNYFAVLNSIYRRSNKRSKTPKSLVTFKLITHKKA